MKNLKLIFILSLLFFNVAAKAQCIWTIKWGIDCSSGPVTISGCGNNSTITFFCAPSNQSDCGCAKNAIYATHSVTLSSALCACDCNSLRLVVNGVSYADGDRICCPGATDVNCGNTCGCARVEIDCVNKEIRLVCP